ncbi:MAG: hypothetical protein AMXMBFR13_24740 [Phycisphaerae bacterium]
MTRRNIHYEAAFVDYLRSRGVPYVPVDETRKVIFAGAKIKSFDLIAYPGGGRQWIVDIKGRQFPYIAEDGSKRYWENWVTREDLDGLGEWERVFGAPFEAQFVFAYVLDGPPDRWPAGQPHTFRDDYYAFLAVSLREYREHCRDRSARWDTVAVGTRIFRQIARPVEAFGLSQA